MYILLFLRDKSDINVFMKINNIQNIFYNQIFITFLIHGHNIHHRVPTKHIYINKRRFA